MARPSDPVPVKISMSSRVHTFHHVGILDSGIGGMTIRNAVLENLPSVKTTYIADHAFMPYGEKTNNFIKHRVLNIIDTLVSLNAQIIIVACNTASVVGIDIYRKKFPDIPIIGVVPVVKTASEQSLSKSYALFSTTSTIKSTYTTQLIEKFSPGMKVYKVGSSSLASYIEKGKAYLPLIKKEISRMTASIPKDVDVVVLGCTHYPLVKKIFEDCLPNGTRILDSSFAVARHAGRILEKLHPVSNDRIHKLYTTGNPVLIQGVIRNYFPSAEVVEFIDIPYHT